MKGRRGPTPTLRLARRRLGSNRGYQGRDCSFKIADFEGAEGDEKGAIDNLQYASSSGGTIRADYGRRFVGMYVFGALRTLKPRHVMSAFGVRSDIAMCHVR